MFKYNYNIILYRIVLTIINNITTQQFIKTKTIAFKATLRAGKMARVANQNTGFASSYPLAEPAI